MPTSRKLRTLLRCLFSDDAGAVIIESAVSIVTMLTVIIGVMEVSIAMSDETFVASAAREATHYAWVRGSTYAGTSCTTTSTQNCMANAANVTSFVQSIAPSTISTSSLVVTTTWPGTDPSGNACTTTNGNNSPGCAVKVKVTYPFGFFLPFGSKSPFNISSTSMTVIAN